MVNLKLSVINKADFSYIKEFVDFAVMRDYKVTFVDNGNIIFEKEGSL